MSVDRTPHRLTPRARLIASAAAVALVVAALPWLTGPLGGALDPAPDPAPATRPATPPLDDITEPAAAEDAPADDALGDDDLFGGALDDDALFGPASDPPSPHTGSAPSDPPPVDATRRAIAPSALTLAALGSLLIGLVTALVATLVGGLLGLASGYRGGPAERVAVRWFADGLDALPQFVVLVTAVALYRDLAGTEGDALLLAIGVLIGLVNSTQVLLVVHHQTRLVASRKYVIAARLMGWPALRVIRRKIVPHLRHELIIPFTQLVIWGVFVETALSYLGFGPSASGATLGAQLHHIDPFARPADVAPAIVMCLVTVGLAAALRAAGDAVEALYAAPPAPEEAA